MFAYDHIHVAVLDVILKKLVNCHTTVETSCTKNPQQTKVTDLEDYS